MRTCTLRARHALCLFEANAGPLQYRRSSGEAVIDIEPEPELTNSWTHSSQPQVSRGNDACLPGEQSMGASVRACPSCSAAGVHACR